MSKIRLFQSMKKKNLQISSRSDLKRRSIIFFRKESPQQEQEEEQRDE